MHSRGGPYGHIHLGHFKENINCIELNNNYYNKEVKTNLKQFLTSAIEGLWLGSKDQQAHIKLYMAGGQ